MPLDISFEDQNGAEQNINVNQLMNQLSSMGYQPQSVTPDGTEITYLQNGQEMVANPVDLVNEIYGNVKGVKPVGDIDTSRVLSSWRMGIEALPTDDNVRKAYLESKLKNQAGVQDPIIVGSGSDWYYYDPKSTKYVAMTNKEGMDLSDIAGLAPSVAKAIGAVGGTTTGAAFGSAFAPGAGSIAGGALGAAAGSQIAREAVEQGAALLDPEYKSALNDYLSTEEGRSKYLKERGVEAGFEGALGGLIPGLGRVAPMLGKALHGGALSRAAQIAGEGTEIAGRGAQLAGEGLQTSLGKSVGAAAIDPTGAYASSLFMELPNMAVSGGTKALSGASRWAEEQGMSGLSKFLKPMSDRVGSLLDLRKAADPAHEALKNAAGRMTGENYVREAGTRDILGNLGERVGGKLNMTEEGVKRAAKVGEAIGGGIENLGKIGSGIGKVAEGTVGVGGKALQGVGWLGEKGGRISKLIGTATGPVESRLLLQKGIDYTNRNTDQVSEELRKKMRDAYRRTAASPRELYGGEHMVD